MDQDVAGYAYYYTRWEDTADVLDFLACYARKKFRVGTHYQVLYDPHPGAAYGRVLAILLQVVPAAEVVPPWEQEYFPAHPLPLQPQGMYVLAQRTVTGQEVSRYTDRELMLRHHLRCQSVQKILAAIEAQEEVQYEDAADPAE
jgi:hypothetical protein